jgi:arylsulfatase A-like enzyme
MGDHSRPIHTFEEAIHIPLIFRHPGRVTTGGVFEGRTCNYDFLPSILALLEVDAERPADHPALSARSYAGQLMGDTALRHERFFNRYADPRWDLWRGGGTRAGRLH